MTVTIDFVQGVDDPASATYTNVTSLNTIDALGYKRLVLHMEGDNGTTRFSTPAYLIQHIEVKDGD